MNNRWCALVVLSGWLVAAAALANQPPPGAPGAAVATPGPITGLTPVANGTLVWDPTNKVYWLADANLAATMQFGVSGIRPDGTMDYPTAKKWVHEMNRANDGAGYLGRTNWQLPVTPPKDKSCAVWSGGDGNSFGPGCTGSALGDLYSVGLKRNYPDSVAPRFNDQIGPFRNLQPGLYWTSETTTSTGSKGDEGQRTFSFTLGGPFANTTTYNYLHVLAMVPGALDGKPTGGGVAAYTSGRAAGKAVFDAAANKGAGVTWLLDANLAASDKLGLTGKTTVGGTGGEKAYTVDQISSNGGMLLSTANQWIAKLQQGYAGSQGWRLPAESDIATLFADLKLRAGDPKLLGKGIVGPFKNLQPFFYWSCEREQSGSSQSQCNGKDAGTHDNKAMEFSFNFDSGFQGTDEDDKTFFVMVYSPGAPPLHCTTPQQCCMQAGGNWTGTHCE